MTRSNKKQPTDKKPPMGTNELWRDIPEGLQGKVRGGTASDLRNANFTGADLTG